MKKIIILIVGLIILCSCGDNKKDENKKTQCKVQVGDYIQFGRYYDEPILWKCEKKDSVGYLLVSDSIICLKPYTAAESGIENEGNSDIEKYGSRKWGISNLREWLNSSDKNVRYSSQPPIKEAIWDGYNDYANESGFLYDFTENEIKEIADNKYEGFEDKVFLLSKSEIEDIWPKRKDRVKKLTKMAAEKSEYKDKDVLDNGKYKYWTREVVSNKNIHSSVIGINDIDGNSPVDFEDSGTDFNFVLSIDESGGYKQNRLLCLGNNGVVPALYVKSEFCEGGKGSKNEPYFKKQIKNLKDKSKKEEIYKDIEIEKKKFSIGDYVQFGKYLNEPILWKNIKKDKNGYLMLSEYILCIKVFDSPESGVFDEGNSETEKFGSSLWKNSNLREWLNSSEKKVRYSSQPPTLGATSGNAYVNEPGFLNNFDIEDIKEINNYKNRGLKDKVFLLSKDDFDYLLPDRIDRTKYFLKKNLKYSKYNNRFDYKDIIENNSYANGDYWILSIINNENHGIFYKWIENEFADQPGVYSNNGVVPVLYLKSNTYKLGKGIKSDPYIK